MTVNEGHSSNQLQEVLVCTRPSQKYRSRTYDDAMMAQDSSTAWPVMVPVVSSGT